MKKRIPLILTASMILVWACDDFLEQEPQDALTTTAFYTSADDAIAAINGAYDGFQHMNYYAFNYPLLLNISGADAVKGGNGAGDRAEYNEFQFYTVSANNIRNQEFYQSAWGGVNRANSVLQNVGAMETNLDFTEGLKTRILGEATFLRALHYYNLATAYGGLPLYTEVPNINEEPLPRSSAGETWEFIINDFENAAASLPDSYDASNVGRATSGAANAMLARIHALLGNWSEVDRYADLVINSPAGYDLAPTYGENFSTQGNNNMESIFEIQYAVSNASISVWNSSGDWNSNWFSKYSAPKHGGAGWGFMSPSEDLVQDYEAGDIRLGETVYQEGDPYGDETFDPDNNNHERDTGSPFGLKKYTVLDFDNSSNNGTDHNYKVIRFGEILLLKAEAQNELSAVSQAALEPLNRIRDRAGLQPINDANNPGLDQSMLRDIILHERRVELAYEGVRFHDLIYRDRAEEFLGDRGYTADDALWPIPAVDIALTDWEQN
ncbi:RagB/SusD family nutrient uptake outer membrane protein [Flavobacteriaceae bacterium GF1]